MYVGKDAGLVDVAEFLGECLFDYLSKLLAVVRKSQVIRGPHFKSFNNAATLEFFAKWSNEVLAVEFADGLAVYFRFREVADYQIETVEVVAAQRLLSFPGHNHFMTQ